VIHWKASCYKFKLLWNYEKCFNTNQTWHKCWLDHCLCTDMLLNFLLPWQRGDISKLPKITILPRFFRSKFISKCCNFSRDWDRVKGFSALVPRYLMIVMGHFYPLTSPQFSWRWMGLRPPSNPPNGRGQIPFLANPWCNIWTGEGAETAYIWGKRLKQN
jgi:hypothetical protein